jgi:hypothetical protein
MLSDNKDFYPTPEIVLAIQKESQMQIFIFENI